MRDFLEHLPDRVMEMRKAFLSKTPGTRKVLGISLGERSLIVAELVGGDKPTLTRAAEMAYPANVTIATPAPLGAALAGFIAQEGFSAKTVVIGLPARWLVTQTKQVPVADARTTSEMLRLSAEAEFSTELKDLVYDYTGTGSAVLLVATPKKYVEAAVAICETAKLNVAAVGATALALGEATGRGSTGVAAKDVLVLQVASGGGEMTLQREANSSALRHLRSPQPEAPFISELRRAVSTMPGTGQSSSSATGLGNGVPAVTSRELILWDGTGLNSSALGEQIGARVRSGDLSLLGVSSNGNGNGQHALARSGQYAAAVALAMEGVSDRPATIDFLHSRLAPPKEHRVPRWAIVAAATVILLVGFTLYAFHDLQVKSAEVDASQAKYDGMKSRIDEATAFVSKVSFAQAWHGGDPRYLACIRDMTIAMSDDADTFAIGLMIGDAPRPPKAADTHALTGMLQGKAADQQHVLKLLNTLRKFPGFVEVTPGGSDAGRGHEVTFSINFRYQLSKVPL